MKEIEIWGIVEDDKFENVLRNVRNQLGEPRIKRRLSIEVSDWNNKNLDTRIRITDGQSEIVQKVGAWNGREKDEIQMELTNDASDVLQMIKILKNYILTGNPRLLIYQFENYVFETEDYELKLSHQFGKGHRYNFEIESKNEATDLDKIAESFGLQEYKEERDIEFWNDWNSLTSLDGLKMSDEEISDIIKKYLI